MSRVLLAEDQPFLRSTISRLLDLHGYTPLIVGCRSDLSEEVHGESEIDAIVTDYVLPDCTGEELLVRARSMLGWTVPAVVVSAWELDETRLPESVYTIKKPFDPSRLIRMLSSICGVGAKEEVALARSRGSWER